MYNSTTTVNDFLNAINSLRKTEVIKGLICYGNETCDFGIMLQSGSIIKIERSNHGN